MSNENFIDIDNKYNIKLNNNINNEYNSDYMENYHNAMDELEENEFFDIPIYSEIDYSSKKNQKLKSKNIFEIK